MRSTAVSRPGVAYHCRELADVDNGLSVREGVLVEYAVGQRSDELLQRFQSIVREISARELLHTWGVTTRARSLARCTNARYIARSQVLGVLTLARRRRRSADVCACARSCVCALMVPAVRVVLVALSTLMLVLAPRARAASGRKVESLAIARWAVRTRSAGKGAIRCAAATATAAAAAAATPAADLPVRVRLAGLKVGDLARAGVARAGVSRGTVGSRARGRIRSRRQNRARPCGTLAGWVRGAGGGSGAATEAGHNHRALSCRIPGRPTRR